MPSRHLCVGHIVPPVVELAREPFGLEPEHLKPLVRVDVVPFSIGFHARELNGHIGDLAPDLDDVARANANKHVAFGYGVHFCLGAGLARMEISKFLGELLEFWPFVWSWMANALCWALRV